MKKATKKRTPSAVALTRRPVQSSLAETLLLDLADRLDPPVKSALELVWQEPPDIVDWAHGNFIDPVTNRLVELAEHQQRLLRAIFRLIWAKKVHTVVWSEVKKSGKCVAANETLMLADGSAVLAKDLIGRKFELPDFSSDLKVITAVKGKASDNGVKSCFEITTAHGFKYVRTAEHPFLTTFGWKAAEALKSGDRLLVPLQLTGLGKRVVDQDIIWMLGQLIADGGANGWTNADAANVRKMSQIAGRLGLDFVNVSKHDWRFTSHQHGGDQVHAPNGIPRFMRKLGLAGKRAYEKFVPAFVFQLTDELIGIFLNGLFSGDGYVDRQGCVSYCTTSKRLADDVHRLLLRLGIISTLKSSICRGCTLGRKYDINLSDQETIQLFAEKVGFTHVSRSKRLAARCQKRLVVDRQADYHVLDKSVWELLDAQRQKQGLSYLDLGSRWGKTHAPKRQRVEPIAQQLGLAELVTLCQSQFGFDEVVSVVPIGRQRTVAIETESHTYLSTCAEHNTTVAGLVGAYWANYVEPPNLIISVANDKEQAAGRIYAAMMPTLARLGWEVPERMPLMENKTTGSKVSAISTNYAGEAGANYGLTLWSELWAYVSESRKRLWEEMTQVPTRQFSVRWVETYAGYLGESELLWELYTRAFKDGKEEEPLGEKVSGVEDLPVWYIPGSSAVVLWSHEPRMPWQTPEFVESQRNAPGMRPNTFLRLWGNYWVSSESVFIDPTQWDVLEDCEPLNPEGDVRPIVLGVDASTKHDSSAIVAAVWNPDGKAPDIVGAWEYKPRYSEAADKVIVDLSETIEAKLVELFETYQVLAVYYDTMQLHSIMTNLQKKYDSKNARHVFVDFPQNQGRTASDQAFYVWIVERKLRRIKHTGLRAHVLNAVAEESDRGFRLDKEKTDQKIDLAVAASMACYGISLKQRPFRKFISLATVGKKEDEKETV